MSRVGKAPITVPSGAQITLNGQDLSVKGSLGELKTQIHSLVTAKLDGGVLTFSPAIEGNKQAIAFQGTMRALVNNMIKGVTEGFSKKLDLKGVGYKAAVQGNVLNLALGFSHPVNYVLPDGIKAETPTPTEIIIKGFDKQRVGQVAAEVRAYRPPEPYKGKGVRYSDEVVIIKETKKK